MVSMTGFAFGETTVGSLRITVEMKSYNNRFLDLILGLPPLLAPWEPRLREILGAAVARGRVEVNVRWKESADQARVEVSEALARQYRDALARLAQVTRLPLKVSASDLAAFPGVLGAVKDQDPAEVRAAVEALVEGLLVEFQAARQREGAQMQRDILSQLEVITEGRRAIAERSASMESVFRENLAKKFRDLAAETDENRILAETALLLVRYGIHEELVRLESHEAAFRSIAVEAGPVGKKLDFLCQELGREINTIGSKTTFADVQQRIVAMKDALENLREQLRNVE